MTGRLGVGVAGCGLIGRRRAVVAAHYERTYCVAVADPNLAAARAAAEATGAEAVAHWHSLLERDDVAILVVATPNNLLATIALAALAAGKHVLIEKPMGRNLGEALRIHAMASGGRPRLKVGFNHRYHPALSAAYRRFAGGEIGALVNIRARYGHGARPGYEKEWRADPTQAGGGELTDQGVHILDLINWFAGVPQFAFAYLQTAVWPLGCLEDNAFGLLRFRSGTVASLHASLTQWKNLFSFEVFGELGALMVEGLGGSYGPETLTVYRRRPEGGAPEAETFSFDGVDPSWDLEWADFVTAILEDRPMLGSVDDGLVAMRMLDALYRSAAAHAPVEV